MPLPIKIWIIWMILCAVTGVLTSAAFTESTRHYTDRLNGLALAGFMGGIVVALLFAALLVAVM